MISEQECAKILNAGKKKYTHDEMLLIRDFLTTLAIIEFDSYKKKVLSSETGTIDHRPPVT
jgi:hypothetical protein